jgi:membrane protein
MSLQRNPPTTAADPTQKPPAPPHGVRGVLTLLWHTIYKFFGDSCGSLAAALSFYTFFSLPALLSLLISVLGSVYDPAQVQHAIVTQVGGFIGEAGAAQIATIIGHAHQSAADHPSIATILSIVVLVFGATTAFAQLQSALNQIWSVEPDPRRNQLKVFFIKRVFSFGVVITVAFLLLVSLVLSTALSAIEHRIAGVGTAPTMLLQVAVTVGSFAITAALFAVMLRYLPDARIAWRDVAAGALGSALLFVLGKWIIGYYLGRMNPGSAYGAAGSLAVVLIWVYYTSMVILMGAEFTEEWARQFGRGIVPEPGAVAYTREEHRVATG